MFNPVRIEKVLLVKPAVQRLVYKNFIIYAYDYQSGPGHLVFVKTLETTDLEIFKVL